MARHVKRDYSQPKTQNAPPVQQQSMQPKMASPAGPVSPIANTVAQSISKKTSWLLLALVLLLVLLLGFLLYKKKRIFSPAASYF